MKKNIFHNIAPVIGISLFVLALWLIHHQLRNYHYHDIVLQIRQVPYYKLVLGLLFAVLSYSVLTVYDFLALRYINQPLAYSKIALVSFIGYAFSYNATVVGGSAAKYRIYSSWGITAIDIGKVVAFCGMTFWLGFLTVGGFVFLIQPLNIPAFVHLPFTTVRPLGVIFLIVVGAYFIFNILKKNSKLMIRDVEISLPLPSATIAQIIIGSLDWTIAGTVFYVLLPGSPDLLYLQLLGVFLFAQVAGLVSYVPGGLGVFDTIILLYLSPVYSAPAIVGYLFVYRMIYYILPLGVASVLLTIKELLEKKHILKQAGAVFGRWFSALVPQVLAFTTFIGGAILLFSGALPSVRGRLFWLRDFVPLPVIEVSHFIGSLIGVALLILARGLQRRLDVAYQITVALLGAGIVFSLLKGLEYEEAIILTIMFAVLLPCHGEFYRKVSLFRQRLTVPWVAAIIFVLLCSVWLGLFSHKHIEYSTELWWKFAFTGDAPRFLRATVGATAFALIFAMVALLRRTSAVPPKLSAQATLEKVQSIVAKSKKIYANLALLGDKSFLFSDSGNALIMYAIEGRSWVAMGDPLGPEDEWDDLIWQFREICDKHNGWSVFYEIDKENLHYYVDLGLAFLKFGEEAIVPLDSFSLEGGQNRNFRYLIKKFESTGCKFEIIPQNNVPNIFDELKNISDAWLKEKTTKEKGFSLGFFDERYLERFPAAVVRQDGKIIAFANILEGADKEELSVDLMRYLTNSSDGAMEYLFLEIMLWGKEQGYKSFNFGMAPLSGLEDRAAAHLWNRFGTYLFQHGEHFYNFRGLRQYKEKFHPLWRPKYIVCPGGLALPNVLINIASLVSGGLKGIISKSK